jgi:8-oxo-dGTP pyrophosphatase MutT (NUDIX family)
MIRAAGIMILCGDKALFLKRADTGEWAFPGGQIEGDETAEQAAAREVKEEIGEAPLSDPVPWMQRVRDGADFTTFAAKAETEFTPTLNEEHIAWTWAPIADPPLPLHLGVAAAIAKIGADELGTARLIAAGELTSPQKYENVWLFAIRITGTGAAYRNGIKEYVWRDPSIYLNEDFLARCNGLSVIWVHPAKGQLLNSQEYADRAIGAVMLPYIQGDEVWAVARIYDEAAADEMSKGEISTSPGVNFLDPSVNTKVQLEDGSALLIEGKPSLLDHIAIVPLGVWDKSGPPVGVLNNSTPDERADSMAEETAAEKEAREKKEREDAARRDASPGEPLDKILSHLDAFSKRMDALEADSKSRRDAEEKREREDAQRRRDSEREDWHKADAAMCERDDAEEEKEREELEKGGEAKEVAADKARKSRKDRMKARADAEEAEMDSKHKADKARRDAEEKARADAEEADRKARADAVAADARKIADAVANLPKSRSDADYGAMMDAQAYADAQAYQHLGLRAPEPLQGESLDGFRVRLARGVQKHSQSWSAVDLHTLQPAALAIAEKQIYADAQVAARNPTDLPEDSLLPRSRTTPEGHRITEFHGKHTFIFGLKRPSQRATAFLTRNQGI